MSHCISTFGWKTTTLCKWETERDELLMPQNFSSSLTKIIFIWNWTFGFFLLYIYKKSLNYVVFNFQCIYIIHYVHYSITCLQKFSIKKCLDTYFDFFLSDYNNKSWKFQIQLEINSSRIWGTKIIRVTWKYDIEKITNMKCEEYSQKTWKQNPIE